MLDGVKLLTSNDRPDLINVTPVQRRIAGSGYHVVSAPLAYMSDMMTRLNHTSPLVGSRAPIDARLDDPGFRWG